ncbi:MAG TPA: hypothetical protein VHC43_01495 [Mycobacteriales bacterium]|nr:hypothetical protein [Mycobacteriales bacterium]
MSWNYTPRPPHTVGRRKHGTFVYYRIADETVFALCEQVCGSVQRDVESLAAALGGAV